MAGYCLYGISTLLLMMALRDGELSKLYPIIALTYVLGDHASPPTISMKHLNWGKVAGMLVIIGGVTLMGRANSKK